MGGSVAWTLRLTPEIAEAAGLDATEYRMKRWTNIFSHSELQGMTSTDAFLSGKRAAVRDAVDSWLGMQEDWLTNKKTKAFKYHMTSTYAPYPLGLKPAEYGVIVTDFVNKVIVSCQGYCDPQAVNVPTEEEESALATKIWRLYKQGRLSELTAYGAAFGWKPQAIPAGLKSYQELVSWSGSEPRRLIRIRVAFPLPWKVYHWLGDSKSDRAEAHSLITNTLKFQLTPAETKAWNAWIRKGNV